MRRNRKGQGMLEYIIIVGAVMVLVIMFATQRMGPSVAGVLNSAKGAVDGVAPTIDNVVP